MTVLLLGLLLFEFMELDYACEQFIQQLHSDVAVDKYVSSWEQQKAWTGIIMWPTVHLSDNKDGRCWMMKRDMA
jgi:hypothetical protein